MKYIEKKISQISQLIGIKQSSDFLINSQWIFLNSNNDKITYSFQKNGRLLISKNGEGVFAIWEFMVDNETIVIQTDKVTIYNCKIIFDDFLVLNKDNTDEILPFANLSNFMNKDKAIIKSHYDELFIKLKSIPNKNIDYRLYILNLYYLLTLLISGKKKEIAKGIINNLVHDKQAGIILDESIEELFGHELSYFLNISEFTFIEQEEIIDPLIEYGVIGL